MNINNVIDSLQIGAYTLKVGYDPDPENPNKGGYTESTFSCFHGIYDLSCDKNEFNSPADLDVYLKSPDVLSLPLYLYDHSGITIKTTPFSCLWDSGQVGYVHITKDQVRSLFGVKRLTKKVLIEVYEYLRAEVATFDQYLTGQIFCFEVEDQDGNTVDSCYGFYEETECREEGMSHINRLTNLNNVA